MTEVGTNGNGEGVFGAGEYAEFLRVKAELKKHVVANMVKDIGNNRVIWRQRMVLRRVDQKDIAPDEDLVAYSLIYKLKNPNSDSKLKTYVTDNEIVAYRDLDPDFNKTLTLADISAKIAELKGAGKLTSAGDKTGDGDDGTDNQVKTE
uniref:Phage tail protein n=1 Tax=Geobacter sp. (strain M21) TaxID=443144 RepID=C6E4K8_GEOSM